MERIWEDENDVRKGVYIARVTHQYDYYFVAGNEKDSLVVRKEHALEIADALQKSEGIDLRAEVARLTAERDRMREALEDLRERFNFFYNASGKNYGPTVFEITWQKFITIANAALQEPTDDTPKFSSLLGFVPGLTGDKSTEEFLDDIRESTND